MPNQLPKSPNVSFLKNKAKSLLKEFKRQDSGVLGFIKAIPEYQELEESDLFALNLSLSDIQFALARYYGFKSWAKLKRFVLDISKENIINQIRTTSTIDISITGGINETNSFASSIAAIIGKWEQSIPDRIIEAYLGIAFSPSQVISEDCMAWWMDGINDTRLDFVSKAFGFSYKKYCHEEKLPDNGKAIPDAILAYYRKIENAFKNGDLIILKTWPSWSIVTRWNNRINDIGFTCAPGMTEAVKEIWGPEKSQVAYVLYQDKTPADELETVLDVIRFGVEMGTGRFTHPDLIFKGNLYLNTATKLKEDLFCGSSKEKDIGCGYRTIKKMERLHNSSIAFLEYSLDFFTRGETTKYLTAAINQYKKMNDLIYEDADFNYLKSKWRDKKYRLKLSEKFLLLKSLHDQAISNLSLFIKST